MGYDELWSDIKKFLSFQYEYVKLTALEKGIVLLSAIALAAVMLLLIAGILFYLSFALVHLINDAINCLWGSYIIVSVAFLLLTLLVYAMRKQLILDPIARFLSKLFMDHTK